MALSLPRFELRFGTTDLSAALKALGVEEAFQGDVGGAFDRMSDDPDTYLNAVFHQVWVAQATWVLACSHQGNSHKRNPQGVSATQANTTQARLIVNEEGTEAAAVTAAVMMTRSLPLPPVPMVVDRPFVFTVRDTRSGLILFVAKVEKLDE